MAEPSEDLSRAAVNQDGTEGRDEPPAGTGDPAVTVPRGISSPNRSKKLVLHVDLNNTILISDAVRAQGTVAALEYFLTTVTWGRMSKHGKWEWLSDSPSLLPPCEGAVSYYSQFGRVVGFTSAAGRQFRGILDDHLEKLLWPKGVKGDREMVIKGEDGRLYHWILPSFFQLLKDLVHEGRDFAVVFRTFGSDLPRVLRVVRKALNDGAHPLFPDLPDLKLNVNPAAGKIRCSKAATVLSRAGERVSSRDGERSLYQYLSSAEGLGGFQDDFDWWVIHAYSIRGGKPLWVDPFDATVQHIFIDDNIRQNDEDTIVHPTVFLDPSTAETRTACSSELYDITLIQTDLLRAISEPNYFTQRVHICMENYERNVQQGAG